VVLDAIDKKNIYELNQYIQYFFQEKQTRLLRHHNLLMKETKLIKTLSGRIMWLKPTFFFSKDSINSLVRAKSSRKIVLIYPQKFSLKTEISSLIADKNKVPFYYYLNNEFNQEEIKKRNEYIFMSKMYFCTLTREYHPILFPDSNISFFFKRGNRDQLKKNLLPLENLRKYPIYNYVWRKKRSLYEKLFGNIGQKPLLFFSSNNNYKKSLLYNVIKKAEKN